MVHMNNLQIEWNNLHMEYGQRMHNDDDKQKNPQDEITLHVLPYPVPSRTIHLQGNQIDHKCHRILDRMEQVVEEDDRLEYTTQSIDTI